MADDKKKVVETEGEEEETEAKESDQLSDGVLDAFEDVTNEEDPEAEEETELFDDEEEDLGDDEERNEW